MAEVPCALGESPFWHPREERVYWVDILLKRLWRLHLPSGQVEHWDVHTEPGSIAPSQSGGLLMALRDGIYLSANWRDTPQKLADAPYDTGRIRFNDGKCDPWGRFWVGTYVESKDRPDAALYCLGKRSKLRPDLVQIAGGALVSNGLAWSPDGRTVYWADSARHEVRTYPLTNAGQFPPVLGLPLTLAQFTPRPEAGSPQPYGGRPDGAAVDHAGRYWVAMYEGARVLCLSPEGKVLAEYPTPAQCPTMVCFGGHDLCTLYLTTARAKRSADELARHPMSGSLFAMRVDVPGLPVGFYQD